MSEFLLERVYIEGKPSKYLVTSHGSVFKLNKDGRVKQMTHQIDKDGYHTVVLHYEGKGYFKRIPRLVAEAFIPNPENKPEVNHKDGNKNNNYYTNLEWVTTKENIRHAWENGLSKPKCGEEHPNSVYTEEQVKRVCEHIQNNDMTMREIGEAENVKYTVVKQIRNKIIWRSISDQYDFSNYTKSGRFKH